MSERTRRAVIELSCAVIVLGGGCLPLLAAAVVVPNYFPNVDTFFDEHRIAFVSVMLPVLISGFTFGLAVWVKFVRRWCSVDDILGILMREPRPPIISDILPWIVVWAYGDGHTQPTRA